MIAAKFCTCCGKPLDGGTSCDHAGTEHAGEPPFDASTATSNGELQGLQPPAEQPAASVTPAKFCTLCAKPLDGATSCDHAGSDYADEPPFSMEPRAPSEIAVKFCTLCGKALDGGTSCDHAGTEFAHEPPFDGSDVRVYLDMETWQFSPEERAASEQALDNIMRVARGAIQAYRGNLSAAQSAQQKAVAQYAKRLVSAQKASAKEKQEKQLQGGRIGSVKLYEQSVSINNQRYTLSENTKAVVDTAGNLMTTRRLTLTRFALLGPLSLFAPKKTHDDKRELYLLVEDANWAAVAKYNPDKGGEARQMAQAIELTARQQTSRRAQARERARRADEQLAQVRDDHSDVEAANAALERARVDTSALAQTCTQLGETLIRVGGDSRAARKARAVLEEGQQLLQTSKLPSPPAPTEVPAHLAELGVGPCCATPRHEQTKRAVRCRLCHATWPLSVSNPETVQDASGASEPSEGPGSLESRPLVPEAAEPLDPPPNVPDAAADQETVERVTESDTVLATIERLAELHRSGILTDEEFAKKKADLLDRL